MILKEELVRIGHFNKPHGINGDLSFSFTDDVFDRVDAPFFVCEIDGILVPFFIESYRFRSDTSALVKLCDIDSDTDARLFTLKEVFIPRSYWDDQIETVSAKDYFIGFCIQLPDNTPVGTVVSIDDTTDNVLFEVESADGALLLIPACDDWVMQIDENKKILVMSLPEGLLEL